MNDSETPQFENRSRICPNCRLLTPAAMARCLECGYLPPEIEAQQREQRERRRAANFVDELLQRKAPFTFIILGVNIAMFFVTMFAGGAADLDILEGFGAFKVELIRSGEWWRLVVPMFLHVGIVHLAFNMYGLWVLGPQIEALYGSARFVMLYVLAGIGGFFVSSFFAGKIMVGVGASGALFGLFGVLFVFIFKYKKELPTLLQRSMRRGIFLTLALNLGLTFLIPFISRSGHLGGLATGMLLALVVPYWRLRDSEPSKFWNIGQVLSLVLVAFSFVVMFARYQGPKPGFRNVGFRSNIEPTSKVMRGLSAFLQFSNEAERTFFIVQKKLETTPVGTPLPGDLKPLNLKARENLGKVPKWEPGADNLVTRLRDLLKDQDAVLDNPDPKAVEALRRKFNEYQQAQREWLEKDGKEYGLAFEESEES